MSEKLTNSQAVIALLKATPDVAVKPRQIAHELKALYPEKYGNHAEGALAGQITAQATAWLVKHPELHRSDDPVQFWWGEPQIETETKIGQTHDNLPAEKDLYPLLAIFLIGRQRKIYAKRIDEKKSKNANGKHGNHWLYPDMVGMEDLTSGWDFAIKNWSAQAGARQARLWSFEVKREITRSTVRPYYFQTVSNSTWANYGYLVAAKIHPEALPELRLLNELHGIGVIQLSVDDPMGSTEIPILAREREAVDWNTCNRIAEENSDFHAFLQLIAQFYATHTAYEAQWGVPPIESP